MEYVSLTLPPPETPPLGGGTCTKKTGSKESVLSFSSEANLLHDNLGHFANLVAVAPLVVERRPGPRQSRPPPSGAGLDYHHAPQFLHDGQGGVQAPERAGLLTFQVPKKRRAEALPGTAGRIRNPYLKVRSALTGRPQTFR